MFDYGEIRHHIRRTPIRQNRPMILASQHVQYMNGSCWTTDLAPSTLVLVQPRLYRWLSYEVLFDLL